MNHNTFKQELSLIIDTEILSLTEKIIDRFPEPFWVKPASSTGKYHPASSQGEGGLVLHTKQVFWIAWTIMDTNIFQVNRDIVLSACLLHDGWKYGTKSDWTIKNHATLAMHEIDKIVRDDGFFVAGRPDWYLCLLDCILAHNGRFTKEWDKTRSWTDEQKVVHLSDMLSSRRFLVFVPENI